MPAAAKRFLADCLDDGAQGSEARSANSQNAVSASAHRESGVRAVGANLKNLGRSTRANFFFWPSTVPHTRRCWMCSRPSCKPSLRVSSSPPVWRANKENTARWLKPTTFCGASPACWSARATAQTMCVGQISIQTRELGELGWALRIRTLRG